MNDRQGKPARGKVASVPGAAAGGRFQSSFDQIAVGIAHTTIDGTILEVNRKLCEMLGYSAAELLGMKTRDLTHPGDRDHQDQMRRELLEGARSHFSGDKRYVRKDGSDFWVNRTVALARDTPDGEPYLIQTIDDINDRKRAEATLLRLGRARRVMAECNHILIHAGDETAMLNSMCRVMVESGGYNQAWIGMPTGDDARPVRAVAYAGYSDDMPMRPPRNPAERNHYPWTTAGEYRGTAAKTIATGKMHIVRDIMNDPQLAHVRFRAQQLGYQCSIALPLAGDGKTLGVLVLHANERDAFDDEEIGLLDELSADIGFGITSLRARAARAEAEQRSRDNEKRFREIFEQAAVGITHVDLNGVLVNCNQKFCDLLGYSREELIGKTTRDITYPEDYGPGVAFRKQLGRGGEKSMVHEKRFVRKDGTPVWTRRTMSATYDAAGKPQYVIAVIEDISDRKELEAHHRETFDQAAVGIVHTSIEGRYLRVNRKFCEMLGYSESELLGREAAEFGRPQDREHDANTRRRMWAGELDSFTEEKQFIRKDGAIVWTNRTVSLARDASGKPLYFIRVIEDITARKEADARYRTTFDNAPIGILHTALDSYRIVHVNPKMCEMLGYTEAELLQMTSTEIVHPDYRFRDGPKYRENMLGGDSRAFSSERKFLRKDGSSFWVNRTVSLARDASGNPLYYIRIVEDITERKQAAELVARERALLRTIVDAIPDQIYVKDREGKYLLANRKWLEARGAQLNDVVGKTAMDFYPRSNAEFIMAREREIMETGIPMLNHQHRKFSTLDGPEKGRAAWISLTKVPLQVSTGKIIGTVNISRDITSEKTAATRREMSHSVSRALAESTTLTEAVPKILQTMCELMGWAYGARWAPDETRKTLRREEYWCATEPDFDPVDREFWLRLDDVGPGRFLRRVWNEKTACWIADLHQEKFKREASTRRLGWRSACAIPVLIDNNIISVLEFFGPEILEPDEPLRETTTAISSQIGQFIQRKQAEDKVTFLAQFDIVTKLPNRFLFTDRLDQALAQARRNGTPTGLLFVDLDHFKAVNDTYGHAAGDNLLRQVAARMKDCVRGGDTVGRLSGDEFAVILTNLSRADDAGLVAQKIVESLAAAFNIDGHQAYISASIGIALYPADGDNAEVLLKNADTAMYRAKEQGRNGYQYYLPQMNERLVARKRLETQLRGALDRNEFLLHYQPKVSLATGAITGFEALLRWQHGEKLVPPAEFIGVLEDTGLIVAAGEWVLNAVCRQLKQWETDGVALLPVAVNLSARQFQVRNLAEVVGRALRNSGVNATLLKLELTESLLMSDAQESVETLYQLKLLGVDLSVDDFGTGYSSLAYLKRFPLDELKIDREFIRDAVSDPDDAAIAVTIINLAHSLKLTVVGEGVETEGQLSFLRMHGCDEIQGYHFSPPLPAQECARLLAEDRRLPQPQSPEKGTSITLLLVVEDENEMKLLQQAFTPDSFRVLTARNADDGFEILARDRVDVVISDNDMSGMSGIQFLTRVRKLYANTLRVLASSGDETPTLTRATNMAGIHLFLPKTWSADRLCNEVKDTLRAYVDATASSGPHPILQSKQD